MKLQKIHNNNQFAIDTLYHLAKAQFDADCLLIDKQHKEEISDKEKIGLLIAGLIIIALTVIPGLI